MIRCRDEKASEILSEFTESVSNVLQELDKKYDELEKIGESERTRAHHTYKILANYFNKRGGTRI